MSNHRDIGVNAGPTARSADTHHQPPATAGGSDKRNASRGTSGPPSSTRAKFPTQRSPIFPTPLTMPKELLDAHRANDEAVERLATATALRENELERLEFLFDLYRQYTEPLAILEEKEARKSKRKGKN